MKRKREENNQSSSSNNNNDMEIVWQTPANPPQKEDYIFHNGKCKHKIN